MIARGSQVKLSVYIESMPSQPPIIRTYQPADDARLEQLIVVLNKDDASLQADAFAAIDNEFRNHDPASDRFVLELAGSIIGYAWIAGDRPDRTDCWLCVAPEHRRKGHGSQLLERILERATQRQATGLMAYLPGDKPALEFASQIGFDIKGYFRELRLPAETPRKIATLPHGWRLEPYSESLDVERYARILDASYADLWGHGLASPDVMQTMLSTLEPQNTFLVIDANGQDVGCAGITKGNPHSIDAPGLIPTHRSAQNYQAVLASALNKLEPGFEVMLNSWGEGDETIAAYLELGFAPRELTAIVGRTI
jgi:GNAT superfamily N-acetyltransferase